MAGRVPAGGSVVVIGQQIVIVILVILLVIATPAQAQQDPCLVCVEEHGWDECPCLPAAPEPPTSSLACVPQTHAITGCDDKTFLPFVGR